MSEQTKAALDEAIAAHAADVSGSGGIITGYVLFAAHVNGRALESGGTGYMSEFAEGQAWHVAYGLAQMLLDQVASGDDDD